MKLRNRLLFIIILSAVNFKTVAQTSCPPDIDFELGATSDWTYYTGWVTLGPAFTFFPTAPIPTLHTVTSASGTDYYGGFPVVGYGLHSFKLNKDTANYNADAVSYNIHVPSIGMYNFIYHYATVLQDPGHISSWQPRFMVNAYDSATGYALIPSYFTTLATDPGYALSPVGSSAYYKTWTTNSFSLAGYGGHTITIKFLASACLDGGHWGYAYLDADCLWESATSIPCNATTITLNGPAGYSSYKWVDSITYATTYGTTQTITVSSTNAYALIVTPDAGVGLPDTFYVHVFPPVTLPPITGTTIVALGHTTNLTETLGGGTWSSANASIATVNSTGVVTGMALGTDTIFYSYGSAVCDTYTIVTVAPTSILSTSTLYNTGKGSINAFPNPAKDFLNITWDNLPASTASITISDVTGREVYKSVIAINTSSGQQQLNIPGLNDGIYLVAIKSDDIIYYCKLVIQK